MDTKKYIIEIPDNTAWLQWVKVSDKDGHVCFDFKDPEDLTPYTELDLEQVRKEAYQQGYTDGCKKHEVEIHAIAYAKGIEDGYQKGLNDAWDTARKILLSKKDGGLLEYDERKAVFGYGNYFLVLKKCSASEAIEKIRQYEQEQEKIKVGNEVDGKCGRGIITKISDDGDHFNVMWENGSTGYYMREDFKKTGRHFSEIAEVLRKMQEEREK